MFLSLGLWLGLFSLGTENLEVLQIKECTAEAVQEGWIINILVANRGTIESNISKIQVNGTTLDHDTDLTNANGLIIPAKDEETIWIKLTNPPYGYGTKAEIIITTLEGNRYIEFVVLSSFIG